MTTPAGSALRRLAALARRGAAKADAMLLLSVFGLLLLAMLWFGIFYHLAEEKEVALQQAATTSEALAQSFGERTFRVLRLIDQTSQFLKFEFEHNGGAGVLRDAIQQPGMLPTDVALLISIADADGKPIVSNQPFAVGSVADRDYFKVHAAVDSDALYISQPVLGRQSGKRVIVFSRRVNHADGSFGGVVLLSIEQGFLTDSYKNSELGEKGLLALVGGDGAFRARRSGDQPYSEQRGDFSRWLGWLGGKRVRFASAPDPVDGVPRIYAKRELAPFPLTAVVGLADEEVLAKIVEGRAEYFVLGLIGSFGIVGFIVLLLLQTYRLRVSERAAKEAHAVLSAAAERSLSAFFILTSVRGPEHEIVDFTVTDINDSGAKFLGVPRERAVGGSLSILRPEFRHDGLFRKCVKVIEDGVALDEEFEVAPEHAAARWLHHQIVPIGDGVAVTTRDISERKHAEIETRGNRAFLQSLIDYLPVLIYARSFRPENRGCTIVWNSAAEAVTGYPATQVIGHTNSEAFLPQLAGQFEKLDREMLADPLVADVPELPFQRLDGGLRYLHLISVPLFDDQNQVEYILGIGEDITGKRAQELKLRTQQAEMAAVSDASPLGLFHVDPHGACTYVNHTFEAIAGLAREQALGDGWANSIHPDDRSRVLQVWGSLAHAQQVQQVAFRLRHADGRVVWASMKIAPILLDGQNHGYVGSLEDITARLEAEHALAESEQRLRTITDTLPALVAYVDADQRIRFANLAYERAFGISREQIRDRTLREFLGDAEYRIVEPHIRRALAGATVTFEKEELSGAGFRCSESTCIPQFAEDGREVIGFHVMTQDITPKKLEERRLLQLAQIDSLTGLVNRAGFEQKLADAMARSQATKALMAVMFLDIDFFKAVNDTHGHLAGDLLLKAFAARLARTLRAIDTVARVGGDEFTIIMEGLGRREDADAVAGKIVQAMRTPFQLEQLTVTVSTSIGIAFYQGQALEPAALIKQADELLYEAKAAGRDTFCAARFADPTANQE